MNQSGKNQAEDAEPISASTAEKDGGQDARKTSVNRWAAKSKTVLLLATAMLAGVSAVLANLETIGDFFSTPSAELQIDDLAAVDDVASPFVDIVVRNAGDRVATINSVTLKVDSIATFPADFAASGLTVDETYDVSIPIAGTLPVEVVAEQVDRKVDADDVDKIRIRYRWEAEFEDGPRYPCAIQLTVSVRYNGDKVVEGPPMVVANHFSKDCFSDLEWRTPPPFRRKQMEESLQQIDSMEGKPSKSLGELIGFVREHLASDEN